MFSGFVKWKNIFFTSYAGLLTLTSLQIDVLSFTFVLNRPNIFMNRWAYDYSPIVVTDRRRGLVLIRLMAE